MGRFQNRFGLVTKRKIPFPAETDDDDDDDDDDDKVQWQALVNIIMNLRQGIF